MGIKVDILIPSKDRALQLHMLFESMARCLKSIGKITVSYQGSANAYIQGYQLLEDRIRNDVVFEQLRANSTEIIFQQRESLSDVIKAIDSLGNSDYIMSLVDDDIFYRPYDFGKAESFKYFREHKDVLACCLRLGDNICKSSDPHMNANIIKEKPILKIKDENMLTWDWTENLINAHNWVCIAASTSHIYRKKKFREWFRRFGRESFLNIEGRAREYLVAKFYRVPWFVVKSINYIDRLQMGILRRTIGVDRCKSIKQLFWEEWLYRRKSAPRDGIPNMMVAPRYSVCYNLDLNNSINRGMNVDILVEFNKQYLQGNVLEYDYFAGLKFYYSILFYKEKPKFVTY